VSSIDRPLTGDVLRFRLDEEQGHTNNPELLARHGRNARTLLKVGPLRVTLVRLRAGGEIAAHTAEGPITVQVLDGALRFRAAGLEHALAIGDLLVVAAGVEHSVASEGGGAFLLTVVQSGGRTWRPRVVHSHPAPGHATSAEVSSPVK
jgi:quercetin dioxygenase-like cupin family protein